MSGDVQPRKRKDKKRKKDDVPVPQGYHWDPEEVMHVQVEQHDGGGRYASLVFYFLLTLLTYYSAKIMYDNRGLIGIESSIENSRFGIWFDGWIEDVKHYDVDQDNAPVIDDEDSDIILDTILDSVSEEESHSEQEDIDLDVEHTGDEEPSAESQELNKEVIGDLAEDISIDNYAIQEDDQRNIIEENLQVPMIKANNKQDHQKGVKPKYTIIYKGNIVDDYDEDQFINGMKNPNKEKEEFKNAKKFDNVKYYKTIIDYTDLIDLDPELDTSKEREIIPEDSDEDQIENENTEQEEIVDNDAGEEEHLRKQEAIKVANSEGGSNFKGDGSNEQWPQEIKRTEDQSSNNAWQRQVENAEAEISDNSELAVNLFRKLLIESPQNLRIRYGYAKALDQRAEEKRSNDLLQDAISTYYNLLQMPDISNEMYLIIAERCIDRMRFRGQFNQAINIHKQMIDRFPKDPKYQNQLAVTLLTINRLADAKHVLQETLKQWPNDGFAQVHFGFVLKTKDNDMVTAIKFLKSGIASRAPGVIDGRFYFHLGDALTRLGRSNEAVKIYEDGVLNKVFLSKYQRSLYNVDRLTGRPWWSHNQTPHSSFFKMLEDNWQVIRNEGLALLNKAGYFKDEAESLRDVGNWKQLELFARGIKMQETCKLCPITCMIIETLADAKNCRRGQAKFSVMHPGTHVWPHCGPTNCRLRAHLGLKVPPKTFIRVAEETRSWQEGKVFIFDDSFEHEVWHNGSDIRMVLIVDIWHPELSATEKRTLPAI